MNKTPKSDRDRELREQKYAREQQRRADVPLMDPIDAGTDLPEGRAPMIRVRPPKAKVKAAPKPKARSKTSVDKATVVKQLEDKVEQVKRRAGRPRTRTDEERRAYRRDWARRKRAENKRDGVA